MPFDSFLGRNLAAGIATDALEPSKKVNSPPEPSRRLLRVIGRAGWASLLVLFIVFLIQQVLLISQGQTDFCQDYIGAQRLLQNLPIYTPLHCWRGILIVPTPQEFDTHPPFTVLLFLPFGLLSKVQATAVWGFLCLTTYLLSGVILLEVLGWRTLRGLALFVAGSALWAPFLHAQLYLNLPQMLFLLLVGAWWLEQHGHQRWAGILLGLAGLIKIWPLGLLLWAMMRRQWGLAVTGGITFLLGSGLALIILGPEAYIGYLGPVQANELYWIPNPNNGSLMGALVRPMTGDPAYHVAPLFLGLSLQTGVRVSEILAGGFLLAILVFLWWTSQRLQHQTQHFLGQGVLIVAFLLVFPLNWDASWIVLLLPLTMILLTLRQVQRPPRWWFTGFGASLLLLVIPQNWSVSFSFLLLKATSPLLVGTGIVSMGIGAYAQLLLLSLQVWLLWQACRPERHPMPSIKALVPDEEVHLREV
jgi:Glycosyltransferase family 87